MDMSAEQWQQRYFGRLKPELEAQETRKEEAVRRESAENELPAGKEPPSNEPVREESPADQDGFRFESYEEPSESTKRPSTATELLIAKKPRTQPPAAKAPIPRPTEATTFKQNPTSEVRILVKVTSTSLFIPRSVPTIKFPPNFIAQGYRSNSVVSSQIFLCCTASYTSSFKYSTCLKIFLPLRHSNGKYHLS